MLPDFVAKATEAKGKVKQVKDGVFNIFVKKDETYMGIPIDWTETVRIDPTTGKEKSPYMLLSLCKCSYDKETRKFTQMGKPVTMKASGTFLADFGIVGASDVEAILNDEYQYIIQTKSGGVIKVNGRDVEIVLADTFVKVNDDGELVR